MVVCGTMLHGVTICRQSLEHTKGQPPGTVAAEDYHSGNSAQVIPALCTKHGLDEYRSELKSGLARDGTKSNDNLDNR